VKRNTLVVAGNEDEVRKALSTAEKSSIFIATTLEAELLLEKSLENYKNPLYSLIDIIKKKEKKDYVFDNFKISYDFCSAQNLQYIRDRLGYFLAELDRSLDLSYIAINKFNPKKIIVGEIKNYPGASVVDGTLKTNAFLIAAKEKGIDYAEIGKNEKAISIRQLIGKQLRNFRHLRKQNIDQKCDLLILATPSHLVKMAHVIEDLKKNGYQVAILTYSLTNALKTEMDKHFDNYYEKERLLNSEIKKKADLFKKSLIKKKIWNRFVDKKFGKNPFALEDIRSKIKNIIEEEIDSVFLDIFLSKKILSSSLPKALLVTTDPDTKILPYIYESKKLGIKTICIQHGAFYAKDSPAIYPMSDYFIAWSSVSKEWLQKTAYFKKIQMFFGKSPFHLGVPKVRTLTKHKTRTILFLATKQPTVDKGLVMFYLRKLFEVLSGLDNLKIIVRVHPFQNLVNLKPLVNQSKNRTYFENNKPLLSVIESADVIIYENTSAGFDAMLSGKPTVYFNPYNGKDYFNVNDHSASLTVLSDADIEKKLPSFLTDRKKWTSYSINGRRFALKYLGLNNSKINLSQIIGKITNN